jgi:hypothetical protein
MLRVVADCWNGVSVKMWLATWSACYSGIKLEGEAEMLRKRSFIGSVMLIKRYFTSEKPTNFSHLLYRKHARASPKQVTSIYVHSKVGHMPTIII